MKKKKRRLKKSIKRFFSLKPHMKYLYGYHYEHSQIEKNTILLESFHGKTINDSPLVCAQEIERLFPNQYKMYYATNNLSEHKPLVSALGINVELVDIDSAKYAKVLASAEYIISNASLPIYFIRKEGQKYLQTWHGTPLKTLGKQMREGIESMYNVQHNFIQASHILFPNEFTRDALMKDYNLESLYTGKSVMCGYPRNKVFFNKETVAATRKKYGIENKTVYAYMPTWRGTSNRSIDNTDYFHEVESIFKKLDAEMHDDQVMYVNFHPILRGEFSFEGYSHIRPFPADISNYEFLNCSDALVTDYSSVFFDFSLTRKPIILFMYDYDEYMKDRGVYIDIAKLPFRQIFDTESFCKCIAEGTSLDDDYSDSDYAKSFLSYDSPDCTEKLLRMFLKDEDCLDVTDYSYNRDRRLKVFKPKRINDRSDLKTLSKVANSDDAVVLMYRNWFKNGVGQMLYDDYNDDFNYVITTNTPPRTYMQQALAKLGSEKAKAHIADNDRKRCFGDLNVDKEYITEYGLIEDGHDVDMSKIIVVGAKIKTTDKGSVLVKPEQKAGVIYKEAILLDASYSLIERSPLSESITDDGYIEYNFKNAVENYLVYNKEYCAPGLMAVDEAGKEHIVCFTDYEREKRIAESKEPLKKLRSYTPSTGTFNLPVDYEKANFKKIYNSPEKYVRETANSFNTRIEDKKLAFVPILDSGKYFNIIRIAVCLNSKAIEYISDAALLKGCRFGDKEIVMKTFLPAWEKEDITGARFILDSNVEDVFVPLDVEVRDVNGGAEVTARLDLNQELAFKPLRWHCAIAVRFDDEERYLRIKCYNRRIANMFKLRNIQSEVVEGWITYPYIGKGSYVKLCYREKTKYDTGKIRVKEITAMGLYYILRPVLKRKEYYLIYEKFSSTAQDNSLYFFKYCMEQLPEKEKKKFMYIIDKEAGDYKYVKQYEPSVIDFMSIKHMVLAMAAKLVISTDSIQHLYVWRSKPSFVLKRIQKKKVLFLQHGVTAMKRVDQLFGKKGSSPMKYFVTTSKTEQTIVVREFGYELKDAPIVGFARWDALQDKSDKNDRFILIMPTWRAWLEDVSDEMFKSSDYCRNYTELMQSKEFTSMLEENDIRVVVYLHPKFATYINSFEAGVSDRIKLIPFGKVPLNELMMQCSMLITDYSSVCWDVFYMDKPVVFYQFDLEKYLQVHGSYIDLTKDLPGARAEKQRELLAELKECIEDDFIIKKQYEEKLADFFTFRDNKNCERTYQFLKSNYKKK